MPRKFRNVHRTTVGPVLQGNFKIRIEGFVKEQVRIHIHKLHNSRIFAREDSRGSAEGHSGYKGFDGTSQLIFGGIGLEQTIQRRSRET